MERSNADRILEEWAHVSSLARPPGLPVRSTGVQAAWAGPSLATATVLIVALAVAGAWFALRPAGTPGAAEASTSPGPMAGPASWWVDQLTLPLSPDATVIRGFIREQACANGASPQGRILDPAIASTAVAVIVTFQVTMSPGDCPSNPAFPVEIHLAEPLAGRLLLDGSEGPPRDATAGDPAGPRPSGPPGPVPSSAPLVASESPVQPDSPVPHCVAIRDWWTSSPVIAVWTTRDRGCRSRSSSVWTPLDVRYDPATGDLGYRFDLIPEGEMLTELRLGRLDGRLVLREATGRDVTLAPIDTLDLPED